MKVAISKQYKRKLSRAAIEKMSIGGSKGSMADKRKAGKLGWQAMIAAQTISPSQKAGGESAAD